MCGLIGAAGPWMNEKDKEVCGLMFLMNSLRGIHGCGIMTLYSRWNDKKKKQNYYYYVDKSELPSSHYVFTEDYKSGVRDNVKILMGHSRWATVGEVKVENNHPFEADKGIIGAHNGTIKGNFEGSKDYGTDSEALINLIEKKGLKEALRIVHKEANDVAYALSLYDPMDDTLSLIRNGKRPLYIGTHGDTTFWSSDPSFMRFAFSRVGWAPESYQIYNLPENALLVLSPLAAKDERVKLTKDFYVPPTFVESYFGRTTYHNVNNTSNVNRVSQPKDTKATKGEKNDPEGRLYFTIGKKTMMPTEFFQKMNRGCACCGNPPAPETEIRFDQHVNEFYCADCVDTLPQFNIKWDDLLKVESDYDLSMIQ